MESQQLDLLLEEEGYERAKAFLMPTASEVETEFSYFKHLGMTIDGWEDTGEDFGGTVN